MKAILAKVERIRARGVATLKLEKESPFFIYNGNTFKVDSIVNPGYGCRVTLLIHNRKVEFNIHQLL